MTTECVDASLKACFGAGWREATDLAFEFVDRVLLPVPWKVVRVLVALCWFRLLVLHGFMRAGPGLYCIGALVCECITYPKNPDHLSRRIIYYSQLFVRVLLVVHLERVFVTWNQEKWGWLRLV